ncbi:uncharacterized protein LOC130053010 [Ostrea edulis]|uniref:uncharacterized protein LOC130053010 n=1 Tax=Ostrea edulis TaxID=37623 RepID=UPI0024AFE995|nr:uncharacterized protein LOC130053010 [Ostrea edulis]
MDTGVCTGLVCLVSFLFLPPVVLETCGFLSPYWIKANASSDCFLGIIYNSNCPGNVIGLGSAGVALHQTTFVFTILQIPSVLMFSLSVLHKSEGILLQLCGCCSLVIISLYPISGILGFAGCMLIVTDYTELSRGWSFDLCLAASVYTLIEILAVVTGVIVNAVRSSNQKSGKSPKQSEETDNGGNVFTGNVQTDNHYKRNTRSADDYKRNAQSDTDSKSNSLLKSAQVAIIASTELFKIPKW